ncbi:MAG: cytidylyltransferase domain-containing protein [Anaerovoracaceae bacterium]|jgi:spore coat polysaccharide biosynthesis protein SpsF
MKLGCIVQARMTSTRLPGKVMKTLDFKTGKTIIEEVIGRLQRVPQIDEIIIATTENANDDVLVAEAEKLGVQAYRGSESDVLSRYYGAAVESGLHEVIRITSDCPFIDPQVVSDLIEKFRGGNYDYASNALKRTYPHGLDCEIFSMEVLEKVNSVAEDDFYREHVTSYIYTHPDEFRLGSLELSGEDYSDLRITVDTVQDYTLSCVLKDMLGEEDTSYRSILKLYEDKPYLKLINGDIVQKKKYDSKKDELEAAYRMLTKQEMERAAAIIKQNLDEG